MIYSGIKMLSEKIIIEERETSIKWYNRMTFTTNLTLWFKWISVNHLEWKQIDVKVFQWFIQVNN